LRDEGICKSLKKKKKKKEKIEKGAI